MGLMFNKEVIFNKEFIFKQNGYRAEVEISLKECIKERAVEYIEFTASGRLYRHGELYTWGQCLDAMASVIEDDHLKRIVELWRRWHLNGMHAGCEHQWHLEHEASEHIGEICSVCGYRFGSSWIVEELPEDIINEIKSW
jgi:hypothetical protein